MRSSPPATPNGTDVAVYLDTSALAKLVVAEAETEALFRWLGSQSAALVSCDVARTELLRLVRRHAPGRVSRARDVLATVTLTTVTTAVFEAAARLDPPEIRSLDAMHLAAALDLGDDLDAMVCYDHRLSDAARGYGIRVAAPGANAD